MALILVIDDDMAVRDAMAFVLKAYGYDIVATGDGERGLAILDASPVDLVIVDRHMPKMSGLEVIRSIRAKQPRLPIIVMSGSIWDDASAATDQFSTGAGFRTIKSVPKPLKPEKLVSLIEELLLADETAD